ncbi:MAG: threonylcarbamoyl-AMP synthase [Ruminococcus sp.]|nr:threonylcarbamoyl-AMP synthase [Ruminococcus sp.]
MNTQLLSSTEKDIDTAADIIRLGGLVAMPTETVYGLAADALNGESVKKIFKAKGRPADNPLIVHIAHLEDIERLELTKNFPEKAKKLAEAFWPGPLTIIVEKGETIPDEVSAGLSTVAIRMPSHPVARKLIERSGCALAAPSANSSGLPSPTTAQHVLDDLSGKIDAVIDGGSCSVGVESTVMTLAGDTPKILRPGFITKEQIEEVIGAIEIDKAVLHHIENNEKAASPGMKYQHYSPRVSVVLVRADENHYINFVNRSQSRFHNIAALCYDEDIERIDAPYVSLGAKKDLATQAKKLFDALRAVDEIEGVEVVYAHCPKAQGVGMALYNRLIRAAAFEVVDIPSLKIIGLTGQTGAGKSEVSKILKDSGMKIIDADRAARLAVEDPRVLQKLTEAFSEEILLPDGTLDRKKTARIAFSTEENTKKLNAVTHPKIIEIMLEEAREASDTGVSFAVFDAPQLFEAGADVYCDCIISVLSDEKLRLNRIMERDSLTQQEARSRMNVQFSEDFFRANSDFFIYNNDGLDALQEQVNMVIEVLNDGVL